MKEILSHFIPGMKKSNKEASPASASPEGVFDFRGYPQEVADSFLKESDQEVVERVARYVAETADHEFPIKSIELESESAGVHVYLNFGTFMDGINWANPRMYPGKYDEYPRRYYGCYGPEDIQTRRAKLLAETLGIPFQVRSADPGSRDSD